MATETEQTETNIGTYAAMFEEYLEGQKWVAPTDLPLVFHLRKLCRLLDSDEKGTAALASAYLQAFSRLDKRRPGAGPSMDPDQTSIFDELDA